VFDETKVAGALAATRFGPLRYVQETRSTNDDAVALLTDERNLGTIVLTEHQTRGRGRRDRQWLDAPGGSLLFTAILPRAIPATTLWAVPFWCALTVAGGVSEATGIELVLQWPNDLLLGEHKACGLLGVSRVTGDTARIACGVGLNVRRPGDDGQSIGYLSDAAPDATRERVFAAIVGAFDRDLSLLADPYAVAKAWEARAGLPGARYRILIDGENEPFDATALWLAADGGLVVDDGRGERRVALADARVLRP
jgi:BirA family biotin operon repressor/biotin-[acetyl-CoA-carboxylase] ligase